MSAFAYGWVYALNIWRMRQAPKEPGLPLPTIRALDEEPQL